MKQPVDHIERPALPWRSGPRVTECGYDVTQVKTLTREKYFARRKDLGQQRSAMLTCMTCSQTATRWGAWIDDPRKAIQREIEWETGWARKGRGQALLDELIVIAEMIAERREEFESRVAVIAQRRDWNARKAARVSHDLG